MKKYAKGEIIKSLDEAANQNFIFMDNKIVHSGWFMSWQARTLNQWIKDGRIRFAIKIKENELEGK